MDTENIIIGVVGLGYVGLPLAHLFASRYTTVGYDYKAQRIEALKRGEDATEMLTGEELKSLENTTAALTAAQTSIAAEQALHAGTISS